MNLARKDKYLTLPILFSIACSLLLCLILLIFYAFLPAKLPLFYSLSWGEAQLTQKLQFLILPANIALISLCNILLYLQLHPSQFLIKRILIISTAVVDIVLFITGLKIITIFI